MKPTPAVPLDLSVTDERQRAQFAWAAAARCDEDFVDVVKRAPALLAASGLMATLAYLQGKRSQGKKSQGKKSDQGKGQLCDKMLAWIAGRSAVPSGYEEVQEALFKCSPRDYRLLTEEVAGMLAWLRYFADARAASGGEA